MEQMSKYQIIYSKRVCEQLMSMGFVPEKVMPNPIKPKFYCWAFEQTEEFGEALYRILNEGRQL